MLIILWKLYEFYRKILEFQRFMYICLFYICLTNPISYTYFESLLDLEKDEEHLLEYYVKLKESNIYLHKERPKIQKRIYRKIVNLRMIYLFERIIEDTKGMIYDYYDLYYMVLDHCDFLNIFLKKTNFLKHIENFCKKREKKMGERIGFQIIEVNKKEDCEEDCPICLEKIENIKICCKKCKIQVDLVCVNNWLNRNTQCIMCRQPWLLDNSNIRMKAQDKKYLEYKFIYYVLT